MQLLRQTIVSHTVKSTDCSQDENLLVLLQGSTNDYRFIWYAGGVAVDLTDCTAGMQIRSDYADADGTVLLELTTANGKLILGTVNGEITIHIMPTDTIGIDWTEGIWDLEVYHPTGHVTRLIGGRVVLDKEVTRLA